MKNSYPRLLIRFLAIIFALTISHTTDAQVKSAAKPKSRADSTAQVRPWDVSMDLYGLSTINLGSC
ncbi:hypothetical protein GCM10010967_36240 [Dyadobacter beijingensis]|uniref:Uncharacterized protein n=1 Tax=Dyadobacter beijingensis TaxID=365489 RepID=A0ABQ2I308_9BACT|nr:hypothetical protein [Dyadobacter beijingensis]GGM99013.1 hypothetical protein GCM10010967_36240 [Dyadobacter beijingensis]